MKKYILSLVAMTIIGTGSISAQHMNHDNDRGHRMEMRGDRGHSHSRMHGDRIAAPGFRGHAHHRGPVAVMAPVPPAPVVHVVHHRPVPCPPPAPVVVGGHCNRTAAAVAVGAVAAVTLASLLSH